MVNYTIELGSAVEWVSGIGSLAAVIVALAGFRVVAAQRAADKRDLEFAAANDLMAVVHDMANHVRALRLHMESNRNDISISTPGSDPIEFKFVQALIGLSNEGDVELPSGTTAMLFKAGAVELWNDVLALRAQCKALTAIMKEYRALWAQAVDLMPLAQSFTGQTGHLSANSDEFARLRPSLIQIDSLVAALDEQTKEADVISRRVTTNIGPTMKAYFGRRFLSFADKGEPTPD